MPHMLLNRRDRMPDAHMRSRKKERYKSFMAENMYKTCGKEEPIKGYESLYMAKYT